MCNDPDGKDGRITIIPPGPNGESGKIIIETVVHVFGTGDSKEYQELAKTLNEGFKNILGAVAEFEDISNKKWTIEFNVVYSAKNVDDLKNTYSEFLKTGDWGNGNVPSEAPKGLSFLNEGDNILAFPNGIAGDLGGNTIASYFTIARNNKHSPYHESFHLLGFPDFEGSLGSYSDKFKNFYDVMTSGASDNYITSTNELMIHPFHYYQILDMFGTSLRSVSAYFKEGLKKPDLSISNKAGVKKSEKMTNFVKTIKQFFSNLGKSTRYSLKPVNPKK